MLQSNRDIWFAAGGPDIEPLVSPTEPMIDHCNRTVTVLQAMVQKHGPQGGLDSHVEDITNAVPGLSLHILVQQHARSFVCLPFPLRKVKLLKVASWEAIKRDRFSVTPSAIYDELVAPPQTKKYLFRSAPSMFCYRRRLPILHWLRCGMRKNFKVSGTRMRLGDKRV